MSDATSLSGITDKCILHSDGSTVHFPTDPTPPPSPVDVDLLSVEPVYGLYIDCDVVPGTDLKKEEFLYTAGAQTRYRKKYFHCFVPVLEDYTPVHLWSKEYEVMDEMDGLSDFSSHFIHANYHDESGRVVKTRMYFIKCPGQECKYCYHLYK